MGLKLNNEEWQILEEKSGSFIIEKDGMTCRLNEINFSQLDAAQKALNAVKSYIEEPTTDDIRIFEAYLQPDGSNYQVLIRYDSSQIENREDHEEVQNRFASLMDQLLDADDRNSSRSTQFDVLQGVYDDGEVPELSLEELEAEFEDDPLEVNESPVTRGVTVSSEEFGLHSFARDPLSFAFNPLMFEFEEEGQEDQHTENTISMPEDLQTPLATADEVNPSQAQIQEEVFEEPDEIVEEVIGAPLEEEFEFSMFDDMDEEIDIKANLDSEEDIIEDVMVEEPAAMADVEETEIEEVLETFVSDDTDVESITEGVHDSEEEVIQDVMTEEADVTSVEDVSDVEAELKED
ncbi:MAG: hypothetical protein ACSW8B_00205, partial [bacterium]